MPSDRDEMLRDVWTLLVPLFITGALVLATGLLLGWSDGALGSAILVTSGVVAAIWGVIRGRAHARR